MGTRHSTLVATVGATESTVGCTPGGGAEGSAGESGSPPGVRGTAPPLTAARGGGPGVRFGLA